MKTVKEIYRRINSTNYALNNMENLFAQYDGPFRRFCEWVSVHSFFEERGIFKETDRKRMFDLNFAITLAISVVQGYPHRNDEHEDFLSKYNTKFPQLKKLQAEFESLFDVVSNYELPSKSRAWKQIDLLTLLAETHHSMFMDRLVFDAPTMGGKLNAFYAEVDQFDQDKTAKGDVAEQGSTIMRYLKAATRASTDRFSRMQRGTIIEAILRS